MPFHITSFYHFARPKLSESQVQAQKTMLQDKGKELQLRGLVILGTEGYNLTVSGSSKDSIEKFKNVFVHELGLKDLSFKDSLADVHPFRMFKVAVRTEIVTLGNPELVPASHQNRHLSPREFHQLMQSEDSVVLDTRNWYETQVGKFKNAIDLKIDEFRDFPEAVRRAQLPKDKNILMYCTGGIRCEKAILEMQKQGYEKVYQLQGGILKYFEEVPNGSFEGDCFVFDRRVAVDQNLQPSHHYGLCPHCGQPGREEITCLRCDTPSKVCEKCYKVEQRRTCSKHCCYQYTIRPGGKGPRQRLL